MRMCGESHGTSVQRAWDDTVLRHEQCGCAIRRLRAWASVHQLALHGSTGHTGVGSHTALPPSGGLFAVTLGQKLIASTIVVSLPQVAPPSTDRFITMSCWPAKSEQPYGSTQERVCT